MASAWTGVNAGSGRPGMNRCHNGIGGFARALAL
ncbi:hypothetical protein MTDSW087_02900 [Methylobacterium dankookense]|uniref:Uncharacterized protein n=1 Tax=Methylobacterium dankookense TaxID=560405 RepID=A0A564G0Q8_9HYPH|nr:hypothetical protein IFDJLNFL_5061 [Methylobacterium dankookense]VUF13201.1 hypothetical protein MTDSW087_02900 [Methylobacterium dankookense]